MNQFAGYEGDATDDELIATLIPRIGVQVHAVIDDLKRGGADPTLAAIIVLFRPEPDCRAARLTDLIAMMTRRGELRIVELLRTERLGPDEYWLAIQRSAADGGVILMTRIQLGEVNVATLVS